MEAVKGMSSVGNRNHFSLVNMRPNPHQHRNYHDFQLEGNELCNEYCKAICKVVKMADVIRVCSGCYLKFFSN